MSKVFIEETTLSSIGDAIREKTGKSALIAPGDMPSEIESITTSSGGGDSSDSNTIPVSFVDGTWKGELVNDEITSIRDGAFYYSGLTKVDCPNVIKLGSATFGYCTDLTTINLPKLEYLPLFSLDMGTLNFSNYTGKLEFPELRWIDNEYSLRGFTKVSELSIPKCVKVSGLNYFNKLETLVLPNVRTLRSLFQSMSQDNNFRKLVCPHFGDDNTIYEYHYQKSDFGIEGYINFYNLTNFDTFIIGGTKYVVPLKTSYVFYNTPIEKGTGYIYVRKSLIEEYKTATNWSVFADQFRAIEDYPEIEEELAQYD